MVANRLRAQVSAMPGLVRMCGGPRRRPGGNFPQALFTSAFNAVREDQQPADMVEQTDTKHLTANGASGNGVAEAVDVGVLIRAPVLVQP